MRKILSVLFLVALVMTLVACQDQKYNNDAVNVMFFTANSNATSVDSYTGLEPGQKIEKPEDPERAGFVFLGWYKDYFNTEEWDFDTDTVGETSIILYAKWEPQIFDIIYDANGGTMPDTYVTEFISGDFKVLPQPRRTGYSFVAWYLYDWVDESSTKPGDPGFQTIPSNYTEDLYLYAHWAPVTVNITFRSNYPISGEGPANPTSQVADYGVVIDFPVLEDTNDYIFLGWNSRSDGQGDWYVNGEILVRTQRITLYGIWQEK